jgi:toxin YhaV
LSAYSSVVVNGWTIYTHPLFDEQYQKLKRKVLQDKQKDSVGFIKKNNTKRFVAIKKLVYEIIPQDPTLSEYRQGSTLGDHHKH